MKNILLMTSTIAPPADAVLLARKDPQMRLADYKASLTFQIGLLKSGVIDTIVYADNSGFPLHQLRDICENAGVSERVEFVSFCSESLPNLGRCFLELILIKRAIAASKQLSAAGHSQIWKLTGRYIVTNLAKIIKEAPYCDLYLNCRNYPEPWADFSLVAFTLRGYRDIVAIDLERYRSVIVGERVLREVIDTRSFPDCKIVKRFTRTPRISGIRGIDGAQYSGFLNTAKYIARAASNRIMPTFWI